MSDEPGSCVQDAEAGQGQGQGLGQGQEAHALESAPMPSHTDDHPAGGSTSSNEDQVPALQASVLQAVGKVQDSCILSTASSTEARKAGT